MKKFFFFTTLILSGCSIQAPFIRPGSPERVPAISSDSLLYTILLIGDAGEPLPDGKETNFTILTRHAAENPRNTTIVFLGDNVYPKGLPDTLSSERKEMERRLDEQIAIAERSGAFGLFVPGNHDWEYQGEDGLATLKRQEEFITAKHLMNVTMLPRDGYPGPSIIDITDSIRIIAIDTQWWLHAFDKPLYNGDTCEAQTKKRFLDSLSRVLSTSKKTIVAAHHPIESYGEHGGFFDWRDHIFPFRKLFHWLWLPLPGIGSLYPLSRMMGISNQDFSGERYEELRRQLDSVLTRSTPVAYVAGHEHALQVLDRRSRHWYLVSGKGIQMHTEALTYGDRTIFASRGTGFMRLDFALDGSVRLGVIEATEDTVRGREVFSMMLH
ncbi:MAG: metallophosphoesterase [Bacteroidota bacterium]